MSSADVLHQIEDVAERLLSRHLASAREWFPHELVPYGRGRDFEPGWVWSESDATLDGVQLDEAARSVLFVNLLTEDNLPYYFRDIERMFGRDGAYGEWVRRWTAEEGRHSLVIRDYLTATRAIDPVWLERARMAQVSKGESPQPASPLAGMVYVTLQELATRVSHRNAGRLLDAAGYDVMARVAADENLHYLYYRDLASAAIEVSPSEMVLAIDEVTDGFAMPGTGIDDFARHSRLIASVGVFDTAVYHEQVLAPVVLKHWSLESLTGLSDAAERARDRVIDRVARTGRLAAALERRRQPAAAALSPEAEPTP